MEDFYSADTARILSDFTRTLQALKLVAREAIAENMRTAKPNWVEIDYTRVSEEVDQQFRAFLNDLGYFAEKRHKDINRWQSTLLISWL